MIQEYVGSLLEQAAEPTHPLFLLQGAPVLNGGNLAGEPPGTQRLPVLVKVAGQMQQFSVLREAVVCPVIPSPPVKHPVSPQYQEVEAIPYQLNQFFLVENSEISLQPGEKR